MTEPVLPTTAATSASAASAALTPGALVEALELAVPLEPVPASQVVAGTPSAGFIELTDQAGEGDATEIGVWEMTPGSMSDTEVDEVFVVIAGDATVTFADAALPPITLRPGAVVHLTAGMQTVWTVRESIRKVSFASPPHLVSAPRSAAPTVRGATR